MKNKVVGLLVVLLVAASCSQNQSSDNENGGAKFSISNILHGKKARKQEFKVHTYIVEDDISSQKVLSFPGRIKAAEEVNLSFKVSGTLSRFYVQEGSKVSKGQLIAEIDPKDYRIQLEATQAQYDQISAEAERVIRLYKDSVTSANNYDKARFGLKQIESKLEFAKNQVQDCKLYSPFSGTVQRKIFESAAVIGAGMPVVTLLSDGTPEVEIEIPNSVFLRRSDIQSCSAEFSQSESTPLKVLSVSPKANANQLYTVRLGIASKPSNMPTPGMITMVRIQFSLSDDSGILIPSSALFEHEGKTCLWILAEDGSVHIKEVEASMIRADGTAKISERLPQGTKIVTAGVHKLTEGMHVAEMEKVSKTNVGGLL